MGVQKLWEVSWSFTGDYVSDFNPLILVNITLDWNSR